MLAVVKTDRAPGMLEIINVKVPRPNAEQVLIKVAACAICGSDVHVFAYDHGYEFIPIPLIFGHEFSGTITEIGSGVKGWQIGDRVVVEAGHYCGYCYQCRLGRTQGCENIKIPGLHKDGGMAEYAITSSCYLHHLDSRLNFLQGSVVEPTGVAVHGVVDNCNISIGDIVIVNGPGFIGLMAAQVARAMGAGEVIVTGITVDENLRLPLARKLGLQTICLGNETLSEGLKRITGQNEADVVVECSGSTEAMVTSLDVLRRGGKMCLVGIYSQPAEIFFTPLIRKEVSISTTYNAKWVNYRQAMDLIGDGLIQVEQIINEFRMENALEAFEGSLNKTISKGVIVP